MRWSASAPSNIALIKYMGKENSANVPTNSSFSYTLEYLRTYVTLEIAAEDTVMQQIAAPTDLGYQQHNLAAANFAWHNNSKAQNRYLDFLKKLKQEQQITENFAIHSANNFPANCGLASSASSFAALTKCALQAFAELKATPIHDTIIQARISQTGSGSSCRSFFSPWCLWNKDEITQPSIDMTDLIHIAVVVDQQEKKVSSSEAHQLVTSSDLFINRHQRAEKRLQNLMQALQNMDWYQAYLITWQEFWDMHALFETAATPFHYMTSSSLDVLDFGRHYWQTHRDGPLITMDAGPNVHLLFRNNQRSAAMDFWHYFAKKYGLLTNMNIP